jgi:hypothetical protein
MPSETSNAPMEPGLDSAHDGVRTFPTPHCLNTQPPPVGRPRRHGGRLFRHIGQTLLREADLPDSRDICLRVEVRVGQPGPMRTSLRSGIPCYQRKNTGNLLRRGQAFAVR